MYNACYMADRNSDSSVLNSLFRSKVKNIYMMIINPEWDFLMHIVFNNLK